MKRLLIIGCGDIARRALPLWLTRYEVHALVRSPDARLAASGVRLAIGDLDSPGTLALPDGAIDLAVHFVPPGRTAGLRDDRTRNLLAALEARGMLPQRFVYTSTSGVYGDCRGERVEESRPLAPGTDRARRRADAEDVLREWAARRGVELLVLRVPGIYAADRLPLERLRAGTPVLRDEDDVFTNHVHADDLAAMLAAALERGAAGAYNASDDSELRMGEWFDLVADRCGLPRAPRVSRDEAQAKIPRELLSFMGESRRLVNRRIKDALGVRLRHPTVYDGVPLQAGILRREVSAT